MSSIVVQVSDRQWSMSWLHQVCAVARRTRSEIVLLHLMTVTNPYLLGTSLAVQPPTRSELRNMHEFELVAEDYGLCVTRQPLQYEAITSALIQAVDQTHAQLLFADISQHGLPLWHQLQLWYLRRELAARQCQLLTLENTDLDLADEWKLSVHLAPSR